MTAFIRLRAGGVARVEIGVREHPADAASDPFPGVERRFPSYAEVHEVLEQLKAGNFSEFEMEPQ